MTELRKRMTECLQLRGLRSELKKPMCVPCTGSLTTITRLFGRLYEFR
jgi:hypothetical protein